MRAGGPYDTAVAIELRTTGADPVGGRVVDIGAAVLREGSIRARFSRRIKPDVSLGPEFLRAAGIPAGELQGAAPLEAVVSELAGFLPEDVPWLVHDASRFTAFLGGRLDTQRASALLDTRELARLCFPLLPDHELVSLQSALDLAPLHEREGPNEIARWSLADCGLILSLWRRLLEKLAGFPLPALAAANGLLSAELTNPLAGVFRFAEQCARSRRPREGEADLPSLFRERTSFPPPRSLPEASDRRPLDEDQVAAMLGPAGEFAAKLPGYEYRAGQVDMARHVTRAFNGVRHLVVEAGTGIGKSLAYLVPSVLYATVNRTPVVVSTNTKNLQSQLFVKDLPLIRDVLDIDFHAALIKGRLNYLCLRKLLYLLNQAEIELTDDERPRLVNVLLWAAVTETGDLSENVVAGQRGFHALASKLVSTAEECSGRACRMHRRCFLRKARANAQAADIIVANHSLVFAEMNMVSPALPPYAHIVLDEAHNLEDAGTRHFSVEVSAPRIRFPLRRLWTPARGRRRRKSRRVENEWRSGKGLVPSILNQVESGSFTGDAELQGRIVERGRGVVEAVRAAGAPVDGFFTVLATLLDGGKRDSVRIRAERKAPGQWAPIMEAKSGMISALAGAMRATEALAEALEELSGGVLPFHQEFVSDLGALVPALKEIVTDIEFVLAAEAEEYVFWVERAFTAQGGARAWGAPVQIGNKLSEELYAQKDTVIFSSATLTVRGSYAFLEKRLGIDRIEPERRMELSAPTPFDYARQCLVMVPTFLPEPGSAGGDYAEVLGEFLADVFRKTRGRGMALFTSYDMLKRTTEAMRPGVVGDGIQILAQGLSGSRENIIRVFKEDLESVLMGTHSFWEGVDAMGETLSCLVVARLPFAVFTDPIIEARCERLEAEGQGAFTGYSLPSAVIRFRQGFGRLIRHRTDRGVVIVTDRRIVSRRYGIWFRASVPARTQTFTDKESLLNAVEQFLGAE